MLAYRHAFHAGNHGDVLKHIVLAETLRYMGEKDKPYTYIDTHAGAGGYSLESRYAQKRGEFENGLGRLWDGGPWPEAVERYLQLVRDFNGGDGAPLKQYPGSPAIAQALLRPTDPMRLFEVHPTDERILATFLADRRLAKVHMSDGFLGLPRELPPPSRRGVVLVDPSYEIKTDYGRVVNALREVMVKFAQAVVLVWYPMVQSVEAVQLPKRLKTAAAAAPKGWLHAALQVQAADERGYGMMGSGLFVLNPPHVLKPMLEGVLPLLAHTLSQVDQPRFVLESSGG